MNQQRAGICAGPQRLMGVLLEARVSLALNKQARLLPREEMKE